GNVTYTVYDDPDHETRVYPGWTGSRPTGPTQMYREDRANGYTETLTMSATPSLTNGVPNGTEAPGNTLQTLTRDLTNPAGQVIEEDNYFNLSQLSYSTTTHLGSVNTNFYATAEAYDSRGRLYQQQMPTGTFYRTD